MNHATVSSIKQRRYSRALLLVLAAGILLRLLFPLADPPLNLTISGAPLGDSGQHSYGARNRVLFGSWSFDDWKPYLTSPLISYALNLCTYRLLGVSFASHKVIPLAFSLLSLGAFLLLVSRRLPRSAVIVSTLFVALSYPLCMYGRTANRYMPMLFFFILSVHFFLRGVESGKPRHFAAAGLMFIGAYASQNHVLYMTGFFLILGGFWWARRRLHWKGLAVFWGVTAAGIATWFLAVFLPNRGFFSHFVAHNSLVRHIYSLPQLLSNIRNTPYAVQFRSDAPVLFLAAMGICVITMLWFRKKRPPLVVEAAMFWLLLGAGFHTIWGYRPTRFYLLMVFPAALLAGWFLESMIQRKNSRLGALSWIGGLFTAIIAFVVMGGWRYLAYLRQRISGEISFLLLLLIFAITFSGLLFANRRYRRYAAILVILIASLVNLAFFRDWVVKREYRICESAALIRQVIPPAHIAGNWASLLSIGSRHKTHLLSGEMGINWRPDFFKKHHVRYLLLTRGRFADEYREYRRLFSAELAQARLMAQFPVFTAQVQLWDLYPGETEGIEMETLTRRPWRVIHDPTASAGMAVIPEGDQKLALSFPLPANPEAAQNLYLRASGQIRGRVRLIEGNQVIRRHLLLGSGSQYQVLRILPGPFRSGQEVEIELASGKPACRLDRVSFSPAD